MKVLEDLYEEPPMPELVENGYYPFYAVSRYKTEDMGQKYGGPNREGKTFEPYLESGLTPWYDIYPLRLPEEPIITSVTTITIDSTPTQVGWYSIGGLYLGSQQPHDRGIYIFNNGNGRKVAIVK